MDKVRKIDAFRWPDFRASRFPATTKEAKGFMRLLNRQALQTRFRCRRRASTEKNS